MRIFDDIVRDVHTSSRKPSSLLPIFRSEAQFALLGEVLGLGREATIGELADELGVAHSTVSREARRLAQAGLLVTRGRGRQTVVSAEPGHPSHGDLRRVLLRAYGPLPVVQDELSSVAGVSSALIYGSWAARWHGVDGPAPRDVDVLVLGGAEPSDVFDAVGRASRRLGLRVDAVVRTEEEWQADETGFARDVRSAPTVALDVVPDAA